ncbi:MAG TPA: ABC transporter ATP-binding protein, partial [Solirubrobacterales bacterium]|nr:ABC transporter ATP-binding protein [Solirubrobacterales bacterium]
RRVATVVPPVTGATLDVTQAERGQRIASAPTAVEIHHLAKTFRLPHQRYSTLKERALHPFRSTSYDELRALRDVHVDIRQGEFFGIVGRNGSGKSTLLKILASIYAADAGRVRMAGRLAPFIELGVGFNPELSARENVELNGVMMGLERREARSRLGAVLEFAELEEFVDMKLKNYSSGMLVRLAFSVMIQSDAEILLIDEVLAVGDASFQQKCADVFHEMRDSDRTVILVTHDMSAVEHYCHRAMLLHNGELKAIGDPGEVARSYLRLNFETAPAGRSEGGDGEETADVVLEEATLLGPDGAGATTIEAEAPLRLSLLFEARREVEGPSFGFSLANADGVEVTGVGVRLAEDLPDRLEPGQRVRIEGEIENRLVPGRYVLKCWVHRHHNLANVVLFAPHVLDFVVYGRPAGGVVALDHDLRASLE